MPVVTGLYRAKGLHTPFAVARLTSSWPSAADTGCPRSPGPRSRLVHAPRPLSPSRHYDRPGGRAPRSPLILPLERAARAARCKPDSRSSSATCSIFSSFGFPVGRDASRSAAPRAITLIGPSTSAPNGTALAMYPAKYTFDTTVAPSCANDFVVFSVNANGGAAQPNLVAFNQLYSGTAGGNGICNRTASGNDTGVAAQVMWSYDFEGMAAGTVPTSPVLSLDGKKVAFVESVAGTGAHFHVLAWRSGDGHGREQAECTYAHRLSVAAAPRSWRRRRWLRARAGRRRICHSALLGTRFLRPTSTTPRTLAYVGNDAGILFRFKNVFCTTAACGTAAPSLDTTLGQWNRFHHSLRR